MLFLIHPSEFKLQKNSRAIRCGKYQLRTSLRKYSCLAQLQFNSFAGPSQTRNLSGGRVCNTFRRMPNPGDNGLGWNMMIGEVLAVAAVVGAFVGKRHLRKRQQAARNERPPQPDKVLRPAGYSASRRVFDLSDSLLFALLGAGGAAVVFGILCAAFYPFAAGMVLGRFTVAQVARGTNPYFWWQGLAMGAVALLWVIAQLSFGSKFEQDLRNWRFGMRGEQAVAEKLA